MAQKPEQKPAVKAPEVKKAPAPAPQKPAEKPPVKKGK